MQPVSKLERRVVAAAGQALARQRFVSPLDVLTGLGWVPAGKVTDWRQGRVPDLESVAAVTPARLADVLEILGRWAVAQGLRPDVVEYPAATRDRRPLRFTAATSGEDAFRTHWSRPGVTVRPPKVPDLVVVRPDRDFTCAGCGQTDAGPLMMEDGAPHCLACVDFDHLVFLPAGDTALTRRAKKASRLSAVVVRHNRARRRYDRLGLLVEPAALDEAERQCLSDEDARARRRERDRERREVMDESFRERLAAEIVRLFPACPPERATAISGHTGVRGSGRVGRSAAGQALDQDAVTRAVIASIRHEDTPYDDLLMDGVPRDEARTRIRDDIDRILTTWRRTP